MRRLVDAHANARGKLTGRVLAAVTAAIAGFDGWYDEAAVAQLALRVVTVVEAGQRQTAAVTDAYLAQVTAEMLGAPVRPVGVLSPREVAGLRAGVEHTAAYARVAEQYRYARSQGAEPGRARDAALLRGNVLAQTDTALAFRAQAARFTAERPVTGYRRVIRPELARTGTCGLCIAAADRVYTRGQLLPIHERCNCGVLPILGEVDPGRDLNGEELGALYDAAGGSTAGEDLKRVRVAVHEHGELGPVLREESHRFRGPARVREDAADPRKRTAVELAALEKSYSQLQERQAAGEDVSKPLAYQGDRIERLRAEAA